MRRALPGVSGTFSAKANLKNFDRYKAFKIVFSLRPRYGEAVAKLTTSRQIKEKEMNVIAKWNPLQELDDFSNRLSTLFGSDEAQKRDENGWFMKARWAPPINISEDENEYLIKADLPGIEKDQVKVTVENGLLLIKGERSGETEEKNKKHHRVEMLYGTFLRSFSLPDNADGTKIKAEFKNGVLSVHLPKSEDAKPKSIEIKVS